MNAAPYQALESSIDEKKVAPLPSLDPPGYQATAPGVDPPPPPHGEPEQHRCRRRRCRRFVHFLVAAFFIWLATRFLLRHCERRRLGPHHWGPDAEFGEYDGHPHHPHHDHPKHDIDTCVDAADWTEYKPDEGHHPPFDVWRRTELSLSSSTEDIFLLSKGFNAFGILHITEAPDRDDIGIDVIVGFHEDSDAFEKTKVCTLRRGDKGQGLGFFFPRLEHRARPERRDGLFFNVTVSLPEGTDLTTIPHFMTHLPHFVHVIEQLPTHTFGSISLQAGHNPVHAEGLVGNKISIHSIRGPVGGTFNVSTSLDIKSCNAPVWAAVNAFNQDNAVPTKVRIHTSNSPLYAELALISTHEDKTNGVFFVDVHTSNSPLDVNFTEQAPDALLKLRAHTSNSPAHVRLDPSFEGTFKLRTSIFHPSVFYEDVEDPTGRGRKRVVHEKTVGRGGRVIVGDAEWVPQDEKVAPHGEVEVTTSHLPLRFSL